MIPYERCTREDGTEVLETHLPGTMLTRFPILNKESAFTAEERDAFNLHGLLPPHISTLEEQVTRAEENLRGFTTDLDKHVFLRVLQDRNEVVFYALLERHVEEILPLIYTPTVAEAVEQFSRLYRHPRGLVVSTETIGRVDELLANLPQPDVKLAVATDSEGILGIGDQGFGGMAICIGKLSLYTLAAGIDPGATLPIELDVGTNRQDLLEDPMYLGVRHRRLTGEAYDAFMEDFVRAFAKRYPDAILQWEDFSKQRAFDLLDRYRDRLPSFNDDIQGTGAVVLSGLLAASRATRRPFSEQVIAIHGAGAGGVGVARQIKSGLIRAGLSENEAHRRVLVHDSKGLIVRGRGGLDVYKDEVAQDPADIVGWSLGGSIPSLLETIQNASVTSLVGLSGQRGAFNETIVRAVDANTPAPIVLPLSNPTHHSEARPEDVLAWTEGRALVATGSPFPDVIREGRRVVIGQGNNAFIFPGVGLGTLVSRAERVTDGMLSAASEALAKAVDAKRLEQGALYPNVAHLRRASRDVAIAVVEQAHAEGVARAERPEDLRTAVDSVMWMPRYVPVVPAGGER